MTKYKDIVGTAIRNNAGNLPTAETGQIFFDSTNVDFKYQFANLLSAWRTGNIMNTTRGQGASNGTQTSAIIYGGDTVNTETYDGTSFTEVNNLNTQRRIMGGAGADNTTALCISGNAPPVTAVVEQWDGSSWTEITDVNTARRNTFGCGSTTAAIMAGG